MPDIEELTGEEIQQLRNILKRRQWLLHGIYTFVIGALLTKLFGAW